MPTLYDPKNYVTEAMLNDVLGAPNSAAETETRAIAANAASRAINQWCGRFFYKGPLAEARFYEALANRIETDDIVSPPAEVVIAFASTPGSYVESSVDLRLYPSNAPAEGRPFTHIRPGPGPQNRIKEGTQVRVTAQYGWPAVPAEVTQAALIQTMRLVNRRHSPYGIAGSPETGSELRLLAALDPDVQALLGPYRKPWTVV